MLCVHRNSIQPTLGLRVSIDSGDAESPWNRLFSLFIFVEFLGHLYEFLSSNSSSICQESSPSEDTLLSMCRVKLVHEQITWKVFANPTVLDSACCASVQFAFAPERMSILVAASRATWFLLSVQECTCSAIRATRCNKFLAHSFRLGYQQIGSIIIGFGLVWIEILCTHTHSRCLGHVAHWRGQNSLDVISFRGLGWKFYAHRKEESGNARYSVLDSSSARYLKCSGFRVWLPSRFTRILPRSSTVGPSIPLCLVMNVSKSE